MKNLKPIRLVLNKPLSGPYDRLLRRPGPEVMAMTAGETAVIIRGTRLVEVLPIWEAETACYYQKGKGQQGWSAEDFSTIQAARNWQPKESVDHLAIPMGYFKLPNAKWVSQLATELTPWRCEVVENWRLGIEQAIWMTVLRLYRFQPIKPEFTKETGLNVRVKPFQANKLQPIISDGDYSQQIDAIQEAVERCADENIQFSGAEIPVERNYDLAEFANETGYSPGQLEQWCGQLRRKKQLIIYGPPGTGKTYLAERLARHLVEEGGGFGELVQFHASYAYEDFVQGIRPVVAKEGLSYELAEGHFLSFCRRARQAGGKPCVLVVDEINRTHLARVFGELMYLLENRDRDIALAAGGTSFSIPANVHIVGTMNTADRSIALVDQALRRRFSFIRLGPDYEILNDHLKKYSLAEGGLIGLIKKINRSIGDKDCELGISFFLVDDLAVALAEIWQGEIEPYLEEVFYDRPDEMARWRWQGLVTKELKGWGQGSE